MSPRPQRTDESVVTVRPPEDHDLAKIRDRDARQDFLDGYAVREVAGRRVLIPAALYVDRVEPAPDPSSGEDDLRHARAALRVVEASGDSYTTPARYAYEAGPREMRMAPQMLGEALCVRTHGRGQGWVTEVLPVLGAYGSHLALSVMVEGLEPQVASKRLRAALEVAFPDQGARVVREKARVVLDERVDVFAEAPGRDLRMIATEVLAREAGYLSHLLRPGERLATRSARVSRPDSTTVLGSSDDD